MIASLTNKQIQRLSDLYRTKPALVTAEMKQALERFGQRVVAVMKRDPWQNNNLHVRTGALRRGFYSNVVAKGRSLLLTVYNDQKYARIQEFGGTITPKKGKYLAIPLNAAKTAAGVSRYPGGPRSVPDLVFIQRQGRNPILAQKSAKGLRPMFVLVSSVKIPARLGFRQRFVQMSSGANSPLKLELTRAAKRILAHGAA